MDEKVFASFFLILLDQTLAAVKINEAAEKEFERPQR